MIRIPLPVTREDFPAYLNAVGLVGVAVEVGVQQGVFSAHLLRHWLGTKLIAVDPWREQADYADAANVGQAEQDRRYEETLAVLAPATSRAEVWRTRSVDAAQRVPDASLDFVYLDARHDEASVAEDIAAWWPKVRSGGILAGHDYFDGDDAATVHVVEIFGNRSAFKVKPAVDAFAAAERVMVMVTPGDFPSSWWVEKP